MCFSALEVLAIYMRILFTNMAIDEISFVTSVDS